MIYEGLTNLFDGGSLVMGIAEEIEILDDCTYIFYLRESKWADGSPLTAHDFERSWKEALDPDFVSRPAYLFYPILNARAAKQGLCPLSKVGVRAIDDKTLKVTLWRPTPYFLELTAYPAFAPCHVDGHTTNGPFSLEEWRHNDMITVQKNPHYWDEERVSIDRIHLMLITDEMTALQLFEKGEIDWLGGNTSPLPLAALSDLENSKLLKWAPTAGTNFTTFNTTILPFSNKKIRKAFACAINRDAIAENVAQKHDIAAHSLVPPVLKMGRCHHLTPPAREDEARRLFAEGLEEIGGEFPRVAYSYFSTEMQRKVAETLQSEWQRVLGVNVELQCNEFITFLSILKQRTYTFGQMCWVPQYFDPMTFLERLYQKDSFRNYTGWEHPEYIRCIEASHFENDQMKRNTKLLEAEKIPADEMPIFPIYHFQMAYVQNENLQGVMISPLGEVDFRYAQLANKSGQE